MIACKNFRSPLLCAFLLAIALGARALPSIDNPALELREDQYAPTVSKLIEQKRYTDAHLYIRVGLQINPRSLKLRYLNAVLLEREGKKDEAVELYEAIIKTYPEVPEPYVNFGALCYELGYLDRAETLLKTAIELRPQNPFAHEKLGFVYLAKAKNLWRKAAFGERRGLQEKLGILETLLKK